MTPSSVLNSYPSTSDFSLPAIAGGQDIVLSILEGARKRYKRRSTQGSYTEGNGAVCAVGAVAREAGMPTRHWPDTDTVGNFGRYLADQCDIEKPIVKGAKEAIKLLNKSANRLFPDNKEYDGGDWGFALERVNQGLKPREYKQAVLAGFSCWPGGNLAGVIANSSH